MNTLRSMMCAGKDDFRVYIRARRSLVYTPTSTTVSFPGRVVDETRVASRPAVLPEISGDGWITGIRQQLLDPDDPWPEGCWFSDTLGGFVETDSK